MSAKCDLKKCNEIGISGLEIRSTHVVHTTPQIRAKSLINKKELKTGEKRAKVRFSSLNTYIYFFLLSL